MHERVGIEAVLLPGNVPRMPGRAGALALLAVMAACSMAAQARAKTHWLCKPGINRAHCTPSLSTTVVSPAGAVLGTQNPRRDQHPSYDCFYVYPTVSDQRRRGRDPARRSPGRRRHNLGHVTRRLRQRLLGGRRRQRHAGDAAERCPAAQPGANADWGLHLTDANIALGDEIRLVERQFRAYEGEHAAK
jgi:hypothetical protein